MGHLASTEQPISNNEGFVAPITDQSAPDELIQLLRRALMASLAAFHQQTVTASTAQSIAEAAYLSTALDVLERLTSSPFAIAPLSVVSVELADVLMQLLAVWKTQAPQHSLELALSGDSPTVMADEGVVTEVTRMLLAAAIGVAPHGGSVRVSLRTQGEGALISIRQSETLLTEDRLKEIFGPFPLLPELDISRRTALLTLPVARHLVESHGGRTWAEGTTRTSGMTFYIWWPDAPTLRPEPETHLTAQLTAPERLPLDRREHVLLILEGDARMARFLRTNAAAHGYEAHTCDNEEDALLCIDREEPDLLLVDEGLPAMDDASLLARLLQYASAPILVLGRSNDPRICARLLDAGAADFVPRPFNMEELMARIRATLRNSQALHSTSTRSGIVTVGNLEIDLAHQQVRESGRAIALSRTEYRLLRTLAQHPGMVISHTQLLERVWGAGYGQETEFLWVYIRRLRRKLEPDPAHPRYILTAPGMGYQLVLDSLSA